MFAVKYYLPIKVVESMDLVIIRRFKDCVDYCKVLQPCDFEI